MFINITHNEAAGNKGSSAGLVHYLDKENRMDKNGEQGLWFNHDRRDIASYETIRAIDNNIGKLSKTDAKFFLINLSPSQKEIAWIKEKYGEPGAKDQLKAYAIQMMDEYARNFKRPGIERNQDLLWFGKLENYRYFSYRDKEVQQGLRKRGERKPGEQMHIQIIVSRKDITNRIKLSPMNNSKGRNAEHSRRMGQFDRSAFKQSAEQVFDKQFGYVRGFSDTFSYVNAKKKGILEQRLSIYSNTRNPALKEYIVEQPSLLPGPASLTTALTKPGQEIAPYIPTRKRNRKGPEQDQELSF